MRVFSSVLSLGLKYVGSNLITRSTDPFQKVDEVLPQTFLPAEKHFVSVSE
jgi:hypothetical protein